jgi:hypothetical protein
MKTTILKTIAAIAFVSGVAFSAAAQSTPRVDSREHAQHARIRQGEASGEITRQESARLRGEQRHIRRAERKVKADGTVTSQERARLNRKQNHAGRDIRRQKHDDQQKPN